MLTDTDTGICRRVVVGLGWVGLWCRSKLRITLDPCAWVLGDVADLSHHSMSRAAQKEGRKEGCGSR